jgi:hypothetical protein
MTRKANKEAKENIRSIIRLPVADQMMMKEQLHTVLKQYLKTRKTTEDIEFLNHGTGGYGLWFGDVRTIAMLGACGARLKLI